MFCLVTGAAGFIGSHIAAELLRRGHRVRIVDNFLTGFRRNLAVLEGHGRDFEIVEGSLSDTSVAERAVEGIDMVFHIAALPSVPRSVLDPVQSQACGEVATLALLVAAVKTGVRRVIYASSSSIYGDTPTLPKVETMTPKPLSPYAATKLAGEGYMSAFASISAMDTICLRYFNVFGERQDPSSQYSGVIARFTDCMRRGERPVIFGDGETTRDFTYIANVVHANMLAMEAPGRWVGEIFNIACGDRISLNDLAAAVNRALGTTLEPRYESARVGDIKHSQADISKAERLLGYHPLVTFEDGILRLVNAPEQVR
jgi:UDP-glucose 4-epimerase